MGARAVEYTRKQVAFLAGLKEGLGVDSASREGKILQGLLQVFQGVLQDLEDLVAHGQYLEDYLSELDDRLDDLESFFRDPEDEKDLYEFLCPLCEEGFYLTNASLTIDDVALEVTCPHCGHRLETEPVSLTEEDLARLDATEAAGEEPGAREEAREEPEVRAPAEGEEASAASRQTDDKAYAHLFGANFRDQNKKQL